MALDNVEADRERPLMKIISELGKGLIIIFTLICAVNTNFNICVIELLYSHLQEVGMFDVSSVYYHGIINVS